MSAATYAKSVKPVEMLDGRRRAWRIGPDEFRVIGRDPIDRYVVKVTEGGVPCCPCPAGSRGNPCWHAALVLARLQREAGCKGAAVEMVGMADLRNLGESSGPPRAPRKRCPR